MPERRPAAGPAAPTTPKHQTGIQWCHVPGYVGATWNPTVGCTRVSPGCSNCYAFTLHDQRFAAQLRAADAFFAERGIVAKDGRGGGTAAVNRPRLARDMGASLPLPPQYDVPFSTVQVLGEDRLTEPLRKRKPHAYFVDSMSDLFHPDVSDEVIDRVFAVMALSPRHLFMILTKRPERMREYIDSAGAVIQRILERTSDEAQAQAIYEAEWPLPNAWIGTSVEDQERADERIPMLLDTPAAVRFLSCEPLLGPVDLSTHLGIAPNHGDLAGLLSWVIVGGESGKGARPFDLGWARSLRDQCAAAGVPYFLKQLGASPYTNPFHRFGQDWIRLKHNHGGNPDEWPQDLRVREWPILRHAQGERAEVSP